MITKIFIVILSCLLIITVSVIIYMKFFTKPPDCPVCLECAQKCLNDCDSNGSAMCKACLLSACCII